MSAKKELLDLLVERSFERRKVTLSSGRTSDFYIDCRQTTLSGRGHLLVGETILAAIESEEEERGRPFDAVAGAALGGCPLASAVSLTAAQRGRELPALYVRKATKDHGANKGVEGDAALKEHLSVVVLEDVVTSGQSAVAAIDRLLDAGHLPKAVFVLVDREEGGCETLEEQTGLEVRSIFKRSHFP
ncbi:MAG TPA: orotate phosphoribosyltransferase [Myxococcales bacterium]|nr:orotate phosphoribosyltransferase [Myxococcales bacterium]|tara:strand:- start:281 stop:844 length:564 start_codon:yes stop_codon:yes gene_type:complete